MRKTMAGTRADVTTTGAPIVTSHRHNEQTDFVAIFGHRTLIN